MAKKMVRRAIADKIPFRWVTADAAYGFSKGWRYELEQADVFHVMATTRHDTVVTRWALDHPVHDLFTGLPRQKWKRRSCGKGAHGLRVFDWARVEVRPWYRPDRRHWVIARRSVRRPQEISYYIAYCPAGTTLDELIHIAGSRWAVEECFQTAKQECGLDDYQVRRYPGWHRHITLAMAAHACLTVLRACAFDARKAETDPPTSSTSAWPRSDACSPASPTANPRPSTTSCTGHTGAESDNTMPALATTHDAAAAHRIAHPSAQTPLQYYAACALAHARRRVSGGRRRGVAGPEHPRHARTPRARRRRGVGHRPHHARRGPTCSSLT